MLENKIITFSDAEPELTEKAKHGMLFSPEDQYVPKPHLPSNKNRNLPAGASLKFLNGREVTVVDLGAKGVLEASDPQGFSRPGTGKLNKSERRRPLK